MKQLINRKKEPFDWSASIPACHERSLRTRKHLIGISSYGKLNARSRFALKASRDACAPVKTLHLFKNVCLGISLFLLISASLACQPNQSILNSSRNSDSTNAASPVERPRETFETALRGVERSGFRFIFVIRRKDNGQFTKEDKTYVRANSPAETNQFVLTDEERVIIAGSNYPFPEENLELLRKIFTVEDLSPDIEPNTNNNVNAEESENVNGKNKDNSNK